MFIKNSVLKEYQPSESTTEPTCFLGFSVNFFRHECKDFI